MPDTVRVIRGFFVDARPSSARVENQVRDSEPLNDDDNDAPTDVAARGLARGRCESIDVDSISVLVDRARRLRRLRVGWRVDSHALCAILEDASRRS